jgi:hypothetical protein
MTHPKKAQPWSASALRRANLPDDGTHVRSRHTGIASHLPNMRSLRQFTRHERRIVHLKDRLPGHADPGM